MTPNSRSYITRRFTQPDSIIPDLFNPQSLNRYAYALNNPIKHNDPTGHSVDCAIGEPGCDSGVYTPPDELINWLYDGEDAGNWAEENWDDFEGECPPGVRCTEFVSNALLAGGLVSKPDIWYPDACAGGQTVWQTAWNYTDALYEYLTEDLGWEAYTIEIPEGQTPAQYFMDNPLPPGAVVFYDTGPTSTMYTYEHAAITTGDISDASIPIVADVDGYITTGPHEITNVSNPGSTTITVVTPP